MPKPRGREKTEIPTETPAFPPEQSPLIPEEQRAKLFDNWIASKTAREHLDHFPVVSLTGWLGPSLLITEMDPENPDHVYGLLNDWNCEPEVSVGVFRFHALVQRYHPISRDAEFAADKSLSAHRAEAEAWWANEHALNEAMFAKLDQQDAEAAAAGAAAALDAAVRSPRKEHPIT